MAMIVRASERSIKGCGGKSTAGHGIVQCHDIVSALCHDMGGA
jgi:hypothetical protein